jgi:RNA-directed DNA polymerase
LASVKLPGFSPTWRHGSAEGFVRIFGGNGSPNRFQELRRRGVQKFNAAVAAGSPTGFWRMSGHPAVQQALRNPYFDGLGLPRLYVSAQA